MKVIGHHLYWDILESLPPGWIVDSRTGSPKHKHVFITNGKHPFEDGFDRALLHIDCTTPAKRLQDDVVEPITADVQLPTGEPLKKTVAVTQENKLVFNELARAKMIERLLSDVRMDLMICEIEGWDKTQYLKQIIATLEGILK